MQSQGLLTVKELSSYLRVSPCTVYRWVEGGVIPCIKRPRLGIRFRREEVDEWLAQGALKPAPNYEPALKVDLRLEKYDKLYLKGGSGAVGKNHRRWRYTFGSVTARPTKSGQTRWYVDFTGKDGERNRQVIKHAQSRGEAVVALQRLIAEHFDRRHNPARSAEKMSFADFADLFLREYSMPRKKSWKWDAYRLEQMKQDFGRIPIGRIGDSDILAYRQKRLSNGVAPTTTNRDLALLKKLFAFGVERELLRNNPARTVKKFSEVDSIRDRVLTPKEEGRLFQVLPAWLRPLATAALHTGMRLGELLMLRWGSVDFDRGRIKVEHTKSHRARLIPINRILRTELERLRATKPFGDVIFPFKKSWTSECFSKACRRAGVLRMTFHDLRRTFGTRLLEGGANIVTVQRLLGHGSVEMTMRYLHPADALSDEAVDRLGDYRSGIAEKGQVPSNLRQTERGFPVAFPLSPLISMN